MINDKTDVPDVMELEVTVKSRVDGYFSSLEAQIHQGGVDIFSMRLKYRERSQLLVSN